MNSPLSPLPLAQLHVRGNLTNLKGGGEEGGGEGQTRNMIEGGWVVKYIKEKLKKGGLPPVLFYYFSKSTHLLIY